MVTKKNSPTTATPSPRPAATRRVVQGDISPSLTVAGIEGFTVDAAVGGAQETKLSALRDVLHGMPEDESIACSRACSRSAGWRSVARSRTLTMN